MSKSVLNCSRQVQCGDENSLAAVVKMDWQLLCYRPPVQCCVEARLAAAVAWQLLWQCCGEYGLAAAVLQVA
jgi:hypothetical protein